jgi:hypothetical protein
MKKLLLCLMTCAALLAACGDDDGPSGSPGATRTASPTPSPSPTAVPTPTPIGPLALTQQPGLPVSLPLNTTGRSQSYVMGMDGGNLIPVGPDVVGSPDGNWFAGKDQRPGQFDLLWVSAPDGSGRHDVDIDQPGTVVWAPDSSMFVVSGLTNTGETVPDHPEIPATRDFLVFPESGASTETRVSGYPAWSPDSSRFAIAGEKGVLYDVSKGKASEFASEISSVNVPTWSSDGEQIAYVGVGATGTDVFVSKPDGGDKRQLTDDAGLEWHPSFSPDGKYVAFHDVQSQGVYSLVLADVESGAISTLIAGENDSGGLGQLAWTDDGKLLITGGTTVDEYYVHIADISEGAMYALIAQPVADLRMRDDGRLTFSVPVPGG